MSRKAKAAKRAGERGPARRPWTPTELRTLFADRPDDPAFYWAARLSLGTGGGRLEEVLSRRGSDFRDAGDGGWLVRYPPKTIQSPWREVPVHSVLIEAGLLELIRNAGDGFLFSNLEVDARAAAPGVSRATSGDTGRASASSLADSTSTDSAARQIRLWRPSAPMTRRARLSPSDRRSSGSDQRRSRIRTICAAARTGAGDGSRSNAFPSASGSASNRSRRGLTLVPAGPGSGAPRRARLRAPGRAASPALFALRMPGLPEAPEATISGVGVLPVAGANLESSCRPLLGRPTSKGAAITPLLSPHTQPSGPPLPLNLAGRGR